MACADIKIYADPVIPVLWFGPPVTDPCIVIEKIIICKITKIVAGEFCISQFLRYIKVEPAAGFSNV